MTYGAIAIYREATAGDDEDNASWHAKDYDTTVREDSSTYEIQSGNTDVTLKQAGHYLVMFNESVYIDDGTRFNCHGRVTYDGDDMYVRGSGYARYTQGCEELYVAGSGIINAASSGLDLNVELERASTESDTATRRADLGGLQILKLDDTWDYFMAQSDTASAVLTLGDEILWENVSEEDSGSFELQANTFDIQVQGGYYLCCYSVPFTCTSLSPPRVGGIAYLLLDGTEIIGSRSFSYGRLADGCAVGIMSCICLFEAASTQNLKLQTTTSNRVGGGQINDTNTSIQIVKLPDDLLAKVWAYDPTGGITMASASFNDMAMNGEIDEDEDIFTHSIVSNTDAIVVDVEGDFLFMAGFFGAASGSPSAATRYNNLCSFRINGTEQKYGNCGGYLRGYDTTTSTFITNLGYSHGFIAPDLDADDELNMAIKRESTYTSFPPSTVANKSAFSAIQLESLFPQTENVIGSYWFAQQGF